MARQQQQQAGARRGMPVAALLLGLAAGVAMLGAVQGNGITTPVNNNNGCNAKFNATLATYYTSKGDTACANLLYTAFAETNTAKCPQTGKGSAVHLCLNTNGTQPAATDAWADLIRQCEYMYIANRQGSSESESGFTYNQDSCFQRFNSWGDFSSWLYDSSAYRAGGSTAGAGSGGGAATIARTAVGVLMGAVLLALALVW